VRVCKKYVPAKIIQYIGMDVIVELEDGKHKQVSVNDIKWPGMNDRVEQEKRERSLHDPDRRAGLQSAEIKNLNIVNKYNALQ
jgi:hypothetical protein